MAFQSSTPPGRRTVFDIQNETEVTLSYRSQPELSSICHSLGIPWEGNAPELISRLMSWKNSYRAPAHAPAFSPGKLDLPSDVSSWLNISERLLDEEESFGLSKLSISDQSNLNNRNYAPLRESSHPIQSIPVAQPNLIPVQTFLPPLPEKSLFEIDSRSANLSYAPIESSAGIFGSQPNYHHNYLSKNPIGLNTQKVDQSQIANSNLDSKADYISLTIESEDSSHSGQNSAPIPFPFPLQNASNDVNLANQGNKSNSLQQSTFIANLNRSNEQKQGTNISRGHDLSAPLSPSNNPFLYPNGGLPIQHSKPDPILVQRNKDTPTPAQVQATSIESNQTSASNTSFAPANLGSTQASMPWIQMNWGSPPTHDQGQRRSSIQQKISPPGQNQFTGQYHGNPPPALDPRHNYPGGQFNKAPSPANGPVNNNPFEQNRRTSLAPEQRQNFPPAQNQRMTPPGQGIVRNDYTGHSPKVSPGQGFGHNYQQKNKTPPTPGFIQNQQPGQYLKLTPPDQFNAQSSHNQLIDLASPPDQSQPHMLNRSKPPVKYAENQDSFSHYNHTDDRSHRNHIPHEIATQASPHAASGQNLLFQSLWDHGDSHTTHPQKDNPFRDTTPRGSQDILACHSQMTSDSPATSEFNSYISQGFENPISITTDWAASPMASETPAPEPAPAKALAPAPGKLLPTSQIEELLIQETGEGISLIPFTELQIGRQIGTGGYKDCFAGTYKGDIVAVGELKVTQFTREDFLEIKNEVNVLKQVYHENIVRFIGIAKGPEKLCIITEFCQRGDLFDQFRREPKPSFEQQLQIMYDIALGVAYLHARRPSIIHRDLKSMNILINKDNKAKINDFGLARIRSRVRSIAHTQCGTPNWQAPEIFAAKPSYTEKVDVYAVGLIFWEILQWGAQPFPFSDIPESSLEIAIRDKRLRPSFSQVQSCPAQLHQLIVQMWDHEPQARPSMTVVTDQLSQLLD